MLPISDSCIMVEGDTVMPVLYLLAKSLLVCTVKKQLELMHVVCFSNYVMLILFSNAIG